MSMPEEEKFNWNMLQEECGELVAAINHMKRGRSQSRAEVLGEMIDVSITLDLCRAYFTAAEFDAMLAKKQQRMRERHE